ncbi:acyltransferase [Clostridium perfringens]|nr:acyltransferase [Clostridium perfringens]
MKIGEDCTIYAPKNTVIDEQYPWMISIGNHVKITNGVIMLTHDYSWSVLKRLDIYNQSGKILGASGKIIIGNNVFIGMNSIILRNVKIGDDVIIGAGSVISKNCESGWVYAGNPAKKIMRVEEFYKKRDKLQLEEAKELAIAYKKRFNELPPIDIFHEYFMLFSNTENLNDNFREKAKLCDNFNDTMQYMKKNEPIFKDFEEFIEFCFNDIK